MLLRLPGVKEMTGLSRSTIYSWITAGRFPAPVKLGPRSVAWVKEEIEAWVNARITESRKRAAPHGVP
jgi:prophage regulatory protein